MKNSLEKYLDYWNSDNEFSYIMRMKGFVWIDNNYLEMLCLIRNVLKDYEKEKVIPKALVYFFGSEIPLIIGTISNPSFLLNPPAPYTEKEYSDLIEKRKKELLKMQENFFCGRYKDI